MWRVLGFCKEEVRSMIIGSYYADGSPVEEVNLRDKGRMFELEACVIKHPRRLVSHFAKLKNLLKR